ncbi:MAG: HAD hydrolase-like protein, partial [Nitrososphaerota archaeon]
YKLFFNLLVKKIRAILTDVDATIMDNRERRIKAVEMVLGVKIEDDQRAKAYNALTVEDVARIAGVDPSDRVLEDIINIFLDDIELYELDTPAEGAVEIFNDLARNGIKIIYVTGRPGVNYIRPFIEKMGFPLGPMYYERITGVGAAEIKKSLFKKALIENKLKPSEVVSLGDMPHDGAASRCLNIYSIGTTQISGVSPEVLKPYFDEVIMHISSLPTLIRKLEKESSQRKT